MEALEALRDLFYFSSSHSAQARTAFENIPLGITSLD